MDKYEKHPNILFPSKDKQFVVHRTAIEIHDDDNDNVANKMHVLRHQSVTPPPVKTQRDEAIPDLLRRGSEQIIMLRHNDEDFIEKARRQERRRAVKSSPLYNWALDDEEKFIEITDSPDYKESGLKKLKSKSWESIARWEKENEFLFALIEDESKWLLHLFPDETIAAETFFNDIEDGVLLCKLAQLCQNYAEDYGKEHNQKVPTFLIHIHSKRKCQSALGKFLRRENVELFLKWCRLYEIPEPLLFESNDVVERTEQEGLRENAREIVLCLMEVARLGVKYGVDPPELIRLEKEIELEEQMENSSVDGSISPISIDSGVDTMDSSFMYHTYDIPNIDSLDEESEYDQKSNQDDNNNTITSLGHQHHAENCRDNNKSSSSKRNASDQIENDHVDSSFPRDNRENGDNGDKRYLNEGNGQDHSGGRGYHNGDKSFDLSRNRHYSENSGSGHVDGSKYSGDKHDNSGQRYDTGDNRYNSDDIDLYRDNENSFHGKNLPGSNRHKDSSRDKRDITSGRRLSGDDEQSRNGRKTCDSDGRNLSQNDEQNDGKNDFGDNHQYDDSDGSWRNKLSNNEGMQNLRNGEQTSEGNDFNQRFSEGKHSGDKQFGDKRDQLTKDGDNHSKDYNSYTINTDKENNFSNNGKSQKHFSGNDNNHSEQNRNSKTNFSDKHHYGENKDLGYTDSNRDNNSYGVEACNKGKNSRDNEYNGDYFGESKNRHITGNHGDENNSSDIQGDSTKDSGDDGGNAVKGYRKISSEGARRRLNLLRKQNTIQGRNHHGNQQRKISQDFPKTELHKKVRKGSNFFIMFIISKNETKLPETVQFLP